MSRKLSNLNNKKGILLLEVIVSVAVLAVGLTTISRSFTNCMRVIETAKDYHTALILAEQVLWEIENKEPEEWDSRGDFEDYPEFSWQQNNVEVEDLSLKELDLDIYWKRRNRDYRFSIVTFMPYEKI